MSSTQKIRLTLSPEAERYVRRDAPAEVRRMAARGALPLPPIELATVLFALAHDLDDQVKQTARESLEALPDSVCQPVLTGDTNPAVLGYLAHVFKDDANKSEALSLNSATDDRTVVFLAGLPHRRVVDIVANNQQRLLRCPEIVDTLGENPLTGRATIDRVLSFLGIERPEAEVSEEGDSEAAPETQLSDEAAEAALRAFLGDDGSAFARELIDDTDGDVEEEDESNLFALIQQMSVLEKIKLARLGNKQARGLLVRDRNKLVSSAAIRSPKISDNEVEGFSRARNIPDAVLRIIAANREWTRNYQVKLGLATNPKCPIPIALKFINFLQERDLRNTMKSKDVPRPVSTHARRLLQKKGKL